MDAFACTQLAFQVKFRDKKMHINIYFQSYSQHHLNKFTFNLHLNHLKHHSTQICDHSNTNGRHFPEDTLKWVFVTEIVWISIKTSLKFVPGGLINNIPTLVQIMAWHRIGNKPLSEPMMTSFTDVYICVTRPQWVNWSSHMLLK